MMDYSCRKDRMLLNCQIIEPGLYVGEIKLKCWGKMLAS